MTLIMRLDVVFGYYKFFLPIDFYPDFSFLGNREGMDYTFKMVLDIKSNSKLSNISVPENTFSRLYDQGRCAKIICNKANQELLIYYRTAEAMEPFLIYATVPDEFYVKKPVEGFDFLSKIMKGKTMLEYAMIACFVPSFEPNIQPQEEDVIKIN